MSTFTSNLNSVLSLSNITFYFKQRLKIIIKWLSLVIIKIISIKLSITKNLIKIWLLRNITIVIHIIIKIVTIILRIAFNYKL